MLLPLRDENPTRRFPAVTVLIIALNVAIFVFQAFSPQGLDGGVAWFAHIGGFLAGIALVLAHRRIRPRRAWVN
jgi:membrane associated rhomboid family serine protease